MINLAIIGCGLIGEKRATAIGEFGKLTACYDQNSELTKSFALKHGCDASPDLNSIFENSEIQAVIIATRHDSLIELAIAAIAKGKHVLIEKPGGRNLEEFTVLLEKLRGEEQVVHIGYNHRYHRAIRRALDMTASGEIGEVMFLRARYGHGGRLGYNKEWRANKDVSGGGELIDQGSHLLDLSIAFLGDVELEFGATPNYYWEMPVEDNSFVVVKNAKGSIGFLHASCTEWKNTFSLEVYGKTGKLEISGLGGSYGIEKLTHFKMLPKMGPPEIYTWEFPMLDDSWGIEVNEFIGDVENRTTHSLNLDSSRKVLEIIGQIYERSGR
jgi:predicted dehydrogenase